VGWAAPAGWLATHSRWLVPLAAGVVPLAAFLSALQPGLPAGDSGELITVAATGGVAHPPGYPLYTLLAGLWLHAFPLGNVAWRLNVFSALCAAAAASVLALAVRRVTASHVAGVIAAWSWAFSTQAFQYALVAEVFSLNALLAACVLWAVLLAPAAGSVALAFLCTLALSHHHTLLLLAAPAFAVSAWQALTPVATRPRLARSIAFAGIAGLVPLAWLPLATHHAGALVWGEASTLRGFVSLLTRAEYGTFRLDAFGAGYNADHTHLMVFARALPHAFGLLPLVLALVGGIVMARAPRGRTPALVLAISLAAQAWFFTRIGFPADVPSLLGVVERFYVMPLLVLAFLAGTGAAACLGRLSVGVRSHAARGALGAILLAATLAPLATGQLARLSQRDNRFSDTLGRGLLASLPRDAVLFVRGDVLHNALAYLTQVEHLRPDVRVLDQELMSYPWYVHRVRARWPDVLPTLGRAERITLADGRRLEGLAIRRADGSVDVLTESGQRTFPAAGVASAAPVAPESLFSATRAAFRRAPFLEQGDDRYSGLPGTRSLLWFDHLAGRRPVAVVDVKDNSWALRYSLVSMGLVELACRRGAEPPAAQQLEVTLAVADAVELGEYFRDYTRESLERTETRRLSSFVARAALLLCLPEAAPVVARHPVGYARVLAFARRFEPLTPSPDPDCLAAIGYLRWVDPSLRALEPARQDLERALLERPALADSARARRVLAALRDSLR
jgi:transmembrane protein TMEM260 (protein O-mannosyltransferase)